jgi:hypothetical protein
MASGRVNRANKAEHMAAPHRICDVKIFLANSEPSTHGPNANCRSLAVKCGIEGQADIQPASRDSRVRPLADLLSTVIIAKPTCLGAVRDGDKPHRLTAHAVDRFHSNRPAR